MLSQKKKTKTQDVGKTSSLLLKKLWGSVLVSNE